LLAQTLNTIHNLAFYLDTMLRARRAIEGGEFAAFVAGVAAPHMA
jgi:queuine/archaeosine tRNA-ribosyltransferase